MFYCWIFFGKISANMRPFWKSFIEVEQTHSRDGGRRLALLLHFSTQLLFIQDSFTVDKLKKWIKQRLAWSFGQKCIQCSQNSSFPKLENSLVRYIKVDQMFNFSQHWLLIPKGTYSIVYSQEVTHPSTNTTQRSFLACNNWCAWSTFIRCDCCRELWQALVIQLLGGRFCWMAWRGEPWWPSVHVDPASALRSASIWTSLGSQGGSGWLRRGIVGQGGNSAAKSPCVGQ